MQTDERTTMLELDEPTERLLVVSIDAHVGPPLADYRPYCEQRHLEDFDTFVKAYAEGTVEGAMPSALAEETLATMTDGCRAAYTERLGQTLIHYDAGAAMRSMDEDGVAAEVVYHGAQNPNPIPFLGQNVFGSSRPYGQGQHYVELAEAGIRIYNRWLVDYCSEAPGRFVGLAQLPMWDIDVAVAEVEFAGRAGLRGLNFPAPRRDLPDFNDLAWEPLWSAAEAWNLPLNTHGGSALAVRDVASYNGVGAVFPLTYDLIVFSRRAIPFMIFGGVFERHPSLKLVLTEQPSEWVETTLRDLDGLWEWSRYKPSIPRKPSEYFHHNCFIGGSFMSNQEAVAAVDQGITHNVMWGRDFPHLEGTWPYTRLSLRKTMEGIPSEAIRRMLGENAVEVFGLDREQLATVATAIAPTLEEIMRPIGSDEALPVDAQWTMAFRGDTAWS